MDLNNVMSTTGEFVIFQMGRQQKWPMQANIELAWNCHMYETSVYCSYGDQPLMLDVDNLHILRILGTPFN